MVTEQRGATGNAAEGGEERFRVLRTSAYRRFGVLRASQHLAERNVTNASEQITAVALFLQRGLGATTDLGFAFEPDEERFLGRMYEILNTTLNRLEEPLASYLRPLDRLALEVQPYVAWDPFQDLAEVLNATHPEAYHRAAARLRRRLPFSTIQLADVADQFVCTVLPQAVRRFDTRLGARADPGAWLDTVFYRYALRMLLSDATAKRQVHELGLYRPSLTPEEILEAELETSVLDVLPEAIARVPARERLALKLYFGVEGKEHSLEEIARSLSCSEYYARAALLDGLAHLAALLGVPGHLERKEFELVQAFFAHGLPLPDAATAVGLPPAEAHRVLREAQAKFAKGLRRRTVVRARPQVDYPSEVEMPEQRTVVSEKEVVAALRALKRMPELRSDEQGWRWARLGADWIPVARVREILRRQPDLLKDLEGRALALDWAVSPDPRLSRADLPSDTAELYDALESLAQRDLVVAQALAARLQEAAEEKDLRIRGEVVEETAHRVLRTLAGASLAIHGKLPRSLRRRGEARYRIDRKAGMLMGQWEDASAPPEDVGKLVMHRASLLGGFEGQMAEILTAIVCEALFEDRQILPGLPAAEPTSTTVWLTWQPHDIRRDTALMPDRKTGS